MNIWCLMAPASSIGLRSIRPIGRSDGRARKSALKRKKENEKGKKKPIIGQLPSSMHMLSFSFSSLLQFLCIEKIRKHNCFFPSSYSFPFSFDDITVFSPSTSPRLPSWPPGTPLFHPLAWRGSWRYRQSASLPQPSAQSFASV